MFPPHSEKALMGEHCILGAGVYAHWFGSRSSRRRTNDVQLIEGAMSIFRSVGAVSRFSFSFSFIFILSVLSTSVLSALQGQSTLLSATLDRIHLTLNIDEAEAVLAILDKRSAGTAATEGDWRHLFATAPYVRLKKREGAMHRDFSDDDFKSFVLSSELAAKAGELRHTLEAWKQTDLAASARRVLSYLPEQAVIKAKVF